MDKDLIYNEDCLLTLKEMSEHCIDLVVTSPPYNTARPQTSTVNNLDCSRYLSYCDRRNNEEYCNWICDIFNGFDRVLKENRVVCWNASYGSENPSCLWQSIAEIQTKTPFMVADVIVWKKKSAFPNDVSPNKLTRICEFIFIFCRKNEYNTFFMNKAVTSTRPTGQKMYENILNFISTANNDGVCDIHKATFSSVMAAKLIHLYSSKDDVVYDPFMGTGTTAVAAKREHRYYIGSEIEQRYVDFANNRIKEKTAQYRLDLF